MMSELLRARISCFHLFFTALLTLPHRRRITLKEKVTIRTLLLGGRSKSKLAKDLRISKELMQYHVNKMEKDGWLERVKGTKNPILYKKGTNPYPDYLSIKLDRGYDSENIQHTSVDNINPDPTGSTSQVPTFDRMVKNWQQASVKSLHMECRIHSIQIGVPITLYEGDISSLPFIDSSPIVLGNNVKKYIGVFKFNQEESYRIWIFSHKKLIVHLPTETVFNAQQLRDWYKRAFKYTGGICDHLSKDYGFEFGEPNISKVHFSFPDNEDLMWFNRELQISTPDCWTDSSRGKVEFETSRMEIALAFFEMPIKILKLEKEMEELKRK